MKIITKEYTRGNKDFKVTEYFPEPLDKVYISILNKEFRIVSIIGYNQILGQASKYYVKLEGYETDPELDSLTWNRTLKRFECW